MNIVMMTNTYKPILGGLEKSVEIFSKEYDRRGHRTLIVAPEFKNAPEEENVLRVPAIQNFNGTDFSVELPVSTELSQRLKEFQPDIIHTHHPFLIGDTALRAAAEFDVPIVFTNHTLYEENTHYVPGDSEALKTFVIELSKGYANLCDQVIAPSRSVADLLQEREVETPVSVVPTGIDVQRFQRGRGRDFRRFYDIPDDAFIAGIVSRIAPEKNAGFLAEAVAQFLKQHKNARFVVTGGGSSLDDVRECFQASGLEDQLLCTGPLRGAPLVKAYHAMNVFVFASHSETQGLVLAEAMAAGIPVVAVDAPGVREVVSDHHNGRLIADDDRDAFAEALEWLYTRDGKELADLRRNARKTARTFAISKCVDRVLKIYQQTIRSRPKSRNVEDSAWKRTIRMLSAQGDLIQNTVKASSKFLAKIPQEIFENAQKDSTITPDGQQAGTVAS